MITTNTKNVMIVGVGGQGSLLASKLMGNALLAKGYDVKVSEVHGMAQRGGSVVTYVRYGEKVYSPVIDEGSADVIIAFEKLEALRWIPFLKKGGAVIMNDQRIDPMPVVIGAAVYPENIEQSIKEMDIKIESLDALSLAIEAGAAKAANVVLLGRMSKHLDITRDEWHEAIRNCVPKKFTDENIKAFNKGAN